MRSIFKLGVAAVALIASDALAGERVHQVRAGESASSIAKHYYGAYERAGLMLRYNDRVDSTIRPGETLRVPWCEVHRVASGDTWSILTRRYVGRPSAWRPIARLNGIAPDVPLRVGQRIVFPVILSHRLRRGETLSMLAEQYYGEPDLADVLELFNEVEDPRRLSAGQSLKVPLISFLLREGSGGKPAPRGATTVATASEKTALKPRVEKGTAVSTEPPGVPTPSTAPAVAEPRQEPPEPVAPALPSTGAFEEELRAAATAYRDGEFGRAHDLLEALRQPVGQGGTLSEQTELWRLLTFVYVAFDRREDVCRAWTALEKLPRGAQLDPDRVSPKILSAVAACRRDGAEIVP